MTATRTAVGPGRITVVQETRFRFTTVDGRGFLFILAHDANLTPDALCRLRDRGDPVTVQYSGQPGLASCVAHRVREA
jgi:hypothetical protein